MNQLICAADNVPLLDMGGGYPVRAASAVEREVFELALGEPPTVGEISRATLEAFDRPGGAMSPWVQV